MQAQDAVLIRKLLRATDVKNPEFERKHKRVSKGPHGGEFTKGGTGGSARQATVGDLLSNKGVAAIQDTLHEHKIFLAEDEDKSRKSILRSVENLVGMDVREMKRQLTKNMPAEAGKLLLEIIETTPSTLQYRIQGQSRKGESMINGTHTIDTGAKTVSLDDLQVSQKLQGKGLSKTFLKNALDFYRSLNLHRVTLNANIDVGSYAWARYGWIPSSALQWKQVRRHVKQLVERGVVKLSPAEGASVKEILADNNPKAIRALAALPSGFALLKGRKDMPGSGWDGVLNLRDADTVKVVYAYIG